MPESQSNKNMTTAQLFRWWMENVEDKAMRGPTVMSGVLGLKYRHQINERIKNDSFKASEIDKALEFWGITHEEFKKKRRLSGIDLNPKKVTIPQIKAQIAVLTDLITKYEKQMEVEQVH